MVLLLRLLKSGNEMIEKRTKSGIRRQKSGNKMVEKRLKSAIEAAEKRLKKGNEMA